MGLKELKSKFTSLDYPDGGAWGGGPVERPLITKPLIDFSGPVANTIDNITDGFIRGGAVTHIERNLTDVERIGKFLITPKGISFLAKQVGLQLSNPKMNAPMGGLVSVSDANQRTYNVGVNTLASIGTAGTGVYFDREGLIPGRHKGYIDAKGGFLGTNLFADDKDPNRSKNQRRNKQENRLLYLFQDKIEDNIGRLSGNGEELYSYGGGPKSLYGIGKTTIKRYTDTGGAISYKAHDLNGKTNVQNFLKTLNKPHFDYSKKTKDQNRYFNRESRVGTGNPGANYTEGLRDNHTNRVNDDGSLNYNVYNEGRVDKVNMLDIVEGTNGDFTGDGFRDLIRFRFEAIKHADPTKAEAMIFRAFLDGFDDSYSANYNETKYNGRAENFYTYNSFKRDVSFSFKIAAQTRHEMMPLYRKLNFLASNTAPEYNKTSGRIMTPYMRVTIGSYLNRVPGVINSIGIKWQKDYPFEISIDSPENGMDSHMLVLPHVLDVNVSFTPIHNFLPQKSISDSPFILPHWDQRDGTLKLKEKWLLPGAQNKNEAGLLGVDKLPVMPNDFNTDSGEGGPPAPTVQTPEEQAGIDPVNEINLPPQSSNPYGF
tara:strand:- start:581 stop:2374 length:1794 start_codon:yes stop_codon:yes gene_type:complete